MLEIDMKIKISIGLISKLYVSRSMHCSESEQSTFQPTHLCLLELFRCDGFQGVLQIDNSIPLNGGQLGTGSTREACVNGE